MGRPLPRVTFRQWPSWLPRTLRRSAPNSSVDIARIGPVGFFESRMAVAPNLRATSTQLLFSGLREDLRQLVKSVVFIVFPSVATLSVFARDPE